MQIRKRYNGLLILAAGLMTALAPSAFAVVATGGNTTNDIDGYRILTFTNGGTLTVTADGNLEVLVVAGGGGGGYGAGGGGGAGGLIYSNAFPVTIGDYPVSIGSGGPGAASTAQTGQNGTNSAFASLTAIGGGGGGSISIATNGASGGSGGGGAGYSLPGNPGNGTPGQGNNGGLNGTAGTSLTGSGGGGAGGGGGTGMQASTGFTNGGLGLAVSISGTAVTYSTGGKGSGTARTTMTAGPANTGNGGDGGGSPDAGKAGGSGIVIVRYVGGGAPVITNISAVAISPDVTRSNVALNGFLVSTGWDANVSAAVVWGTNDAGVKLAGWTYTNLFPGWSPAGTLSTNVRPIQAGATYYYRFHASNSFGYAWSATAGSFTAPGMTIGAAQDNYIYYMDSANVYFGNTVMGNGGSNTLVSVRGQNTAKQSAKSWIRFDLTGLDYNAKTSAIVMVTAARAGTQAWAASLRLYALKSGFTPGAGVLGTDWTEGTITWNNAPGNGGSATNDGRICDAATTTLIGSTNPPSTIQGDRFAFTFDSLTNYVQADQSMTVMLTFFPANNGTEFASKEHASLAGPKLMVSLMDHPRAGVLMMLR